MTILEMGFLRHREFLVKAALPLAFAFAATFSYPTKIKTHQVVLISKTLVIQTSKIDPPRIAFDEVNQNKKAAPSDWNINSSRKGIALLSGEANLWKTPAKDMFRVRRVHIPEMVFTENDVSQYVQEQRWYANLSSRDSERIAMANQKFNTLEEDWAPPTLEQATLQSIAEVAKQDPQVQSRLNNRRDPSTMSGQIELQGGLPSGPHWAIEVARYQENIKKEDAKVDSKKSTFEIQVEDFSGSLQARLKDVRTGQVIGEGSLRLSQTASTSVAKIVIQKSNDDVSSAWSSFYKNPGRLSAEGDSGRNNVPADVLFASINTAGKTDASGLYHFDQIRRGSRGLVRTQAESFYPGMDMVKAGENKSRPLFPEKMIKALRDIIRDQAVASEYAETGSVVWGQVLQNGKPTTGAEVSVEGFPGYKAVYLNSLLIPDPKQKGTSENGYFIILDLPAGFHSLLATRGEVYLSHVNTVVDDDTLSTAEIFINDVKNSTDLKVFDAFNGTPQQASVEIQSLPEAIDVLGYAEVNIPAVDRMSFMNITPNNPGYLKTMMSYEDTQDFLHIPLISANWIQGILIRQKANLFPDRGMIVGFVDSENYDVYLGYDSAFSRDNIVYFTAQGMVSDKSVAGGGFVIFNVPMGPQSVVITEGETDMIRTQLADVNSEATSVIKF